MILIVESGATKSDWRAVSMDRKEMKRVIAEGVNVSTMKASAIKDIISDAEKNAAVALRELESNPDHPGLLYYSAISKLRANILDENEIFNEIKAANMYIRKNYNVNDKIIADMFIMTLNESLKKSYKLYERLIVMYSEYEEKTKIVDKVLKSRLISEENKDIILLDYLNDIL